ncbi:MAG TPA: bifunctional shikimate kinase/3-dehydroquinate synthase [Candidatus Kapabacteria bacterium]|nr:bifunctional shikimate kinase/3-dehydroquinate synthase [Candidatus Kapabacteria bacterium]
MIIWLHGPSGAGKTTIGRELAGLRGVPFVDLDEEIERQEGRSVADIFWSDGEAAFRRLEWNALLALMEGERTPKVVALGGGAVVDHDVRTLMRGSGLRVFVDVEPEVAMARLEGDAPRPLLYDDDPPAKWRRLYNARRRYYEETDVTVRSDRTPAEMARAIAEEIDRAGDALWTWPADIGGERCVVAGFGALYALAQAMRALTQGRRVCLVTDRLVERYYADYLFPEREREGMITLAVDASEGTKTLATVEELAAGMVAGGFTREGVIVAVGGGVVTDMAGFLGAIFMRGVRTIYVPTTLLAQVDAAIGGKTAVNAAGVRNLIGAFRQPGHVLVASQFLRSLTARELRSGFVESVKMGIINSKPLGAAVDAALPAILEGELPENIDDVIRLSIRAKLDVVEQDARDSSLRLSLNFGHTFGHALEAVESGVYAHGEAVAFGMIAAAAMAYERGTISGERRDRIAQCSLPFTVHERDTHNMNALLRAMESDKKRAGGGYRFVLPTESEGFSLYDTDDRELVVRTMEAAFRDIAARHR